MRAGRFGFAEGCSARAGTWFSRHGGNSIRHAATFLLRLRNNVSTLFSQGVDSFTVISVTFGAAYLRGDISAEQLMVLMGSNYLFKMFAALLDTLPFYYLTGKLKRYLQFAD